MKEFTLLDTISQDGFYLTQGYGVNESYYKKFGLLYHEGIDLGHKNKTQPFRSPIDGIVVQDWDTTKGNYGEYIVIWDDAQNCALWICHNSKNFVDYGQRVKAGDVVCNMGATGNVTGAHIHLNFVQTNAQGSRLYNSKNTNIGFLDPQHPLDPNPPKYPPSVNHYKVNWVHKLPKEISMPVSNTNDLFYEDVKGFGAIDFGDKAQVERFIEEFQKNRERISDARNERDKFKEQVRNLEELIKKLKDDHKSIIEGLALEAKVQKQNFKEFRQKLAEELDTTQDEAEIEGQVRKLVRVEDQLGATREELEQLKLQHNNLTEINNGLTNTINDLKEELKTAKGLKQASDDELVTEFLTRKIHYLSDLLKRLLKIKQGIKND